MSRTLSRMCVLLVLVSGQESQEPEARLISSEITLDLEIQIEVEEPKNDGTNNTKEGTLGPTIEAVEATLYADEDYDDYEVKGNDSLNTKSDNTTLPILVSKRTTGGLSNNISVTVRPSDSDLSNSQNRSVISTTNKERTIQQNTTLMETSTTISEITFESDKGVTSGNITTGSTIDIGQAGDETVKKEKYSNVSLVQLLFFFIFVLVMGTNFKFSCLHVNFVHLCSKFLLLYRSNQQLLASNRKENGKGNHQISKSRL